MGEYKPWRNQFDDKSVNGLPLPKLLLDLMKSGRWKHPGDKVMLAAIPFLKDPVVFLRSPEHIAAQTNFFPDDHDRFPKLMFFHEYRGTGSPERPLPWLDAESAFFIATTKNIGDDVAIALDYRSDRDDPKVVATDWQSGEGCLWREVSPTFTEFVKLLGIEYREN